MFFSFDQNEIGLTFFVGRCCIRERYAASGSPCPDVIRRFLKFRSFSARLLSHSLFSCLCSAFSVGPKEGSIIGELNGFRMIFRKYPSAHFSHVIKCTSFKKYSSSKFNQLPTKSQLSSSHPWEVLVTLSSYLFMNPIYFFLLSFVSVSFLGNRCLTQGHEDSLLYFLCKRMRVLALRFKFIIYFEVTSEHGVK